MATHINGKITEALRIAGRGTVLLVNGTNVSAASNIDKVTLIINGKEYHARGIERSGIDPNNVGFVMANDILPTDIIVPCDIEVVIDE